MLNARSGRSYFGVYKKDEVIEQDQVLGNDEVLSYISAHPTYLVSGECEHLGVRSAEFDLARELANAMDEKHLVNNLFKLDPTYLKDLYQ